MAQIGRTWLRSAGRACFCVSTRHTLSPTFSESHERGGSDAHSVFRRNTLLGNRMHTQCAYEQHTNPQLPAAKPLQGGPSGLPPFLRARPLGPLAPTLSGKRADVASIDSLFLILVRRVGFASPSSSSPLRSCPVLHKLIPWRCSARASVRRPPRRMFCVSVLWASAASQAPWRRRRPP